MKIFFPCVGLLLLPLLLQAQCNDTCWPSLVPNGDLEAISEPGCTQSASDELFSNQSPVLGWQGALPVGSLFGEYTPDYFNPLCLSGNPAIGVGQSAAIGIFTVTFPGDPASEWVQVQLNEPLVQGLEYCIAFFAFSYAELGSPGDGLDVAILSNPVNQSPFADGENPTNFIPAYSNPPGVFIPETLTPYSFTYCASGGEQWLAFGNQNADQTTTEQPGTQAYVVIDNVTLRERCGQQIPDFDIVTSSNLLDCAECAELSFDFMGAVPLPVTWDNGIGEVNGPVEVCPTQNTTYTATVSRESCNGELFSESLSIDIDVDCTDELIVSLQGGSICLAEDFILEAQVSGGVPGYTFQWAPIDFGNSGGPFTVSPSETTVYEVVVTDATGTTAIAQANVVVIIESLEINLPEALDLCNGPVTLDATAPDAVSYLWSNGSTETTVTLNQAGTFSVEVFGECSSVTQEVFIQPCPIDLSVDLAGGFICAGESFDLEAEIVGGIAPYQISWAPGFSTQQVYNVSPESTTVYTVNVVDAENTTATASATVQVVSADLALSLGPDQVICPGDTVVLDAFLGEGFTYTWNTGFSSPSLSVTRAGTYSVRVPTPCALLTDTVVFAAGIPPLNYAREALRCEGTPVEIGPPLSENYEVFWLDGTVGARRSVSEPGFYEGSLIAEACPSPIPLGVNVDFINCDCDIYVPNAFTPNGDGLNDLFKVVPNCSIETFSMRIFNRWGSEVFSSDSPDDAWSGYSANQDYYGDNEIYAYLITILPKNELFAPEPIVLRGSLMLLR